MSDKQKKNLSEEMKEEYLRELDQFENVNVSGGGLSSWLGNDGRFCTLSVECMPSCN
ncbi:lichenicidin alpha family lanthipeptide [Paraliobacillus zengyii]|uniref:lichenicidin alpha family lanthipeptide n=1 Tax=Paraliobacillus zengyii TaxID=2213194 RepID=UPI000E3BD0EE|nr:lichenicidin alpha family lanthipeptide [Paraliobacillus zengyii]